MRIRVIALNRLAAFMVCGVFLLAAAGFAIRGAGLVMAAGDAGSTDGDAPGSGVLTDTPQDKQSASVTVSAPKQGEAAPGGGTSLSYSAGDAVAAAAAQDGVIEEDEHDPDKLAGEHITIEIAGISAKAPEKKDKPRVLIYHTHTYEAYEQDAANTYALASGAKWRTENCDRNIVRVGAELAELLKGMGFEVVHDTTAFEPPKLGTAYVRSLEMLKQRMSAGEEYDLIIDMHRDAYSQRSWSPKNVTINGKNCARLMFLIGTGEDGFTEKPNWKANYALADSLVKQLQSINPDLCKDVNVKTQRYNQHVSEKCVLIEVGHCENTLDEAIASMQYLAKAISGVLSKN